MKTGKLLVVEGPNGVGKGLVTEIVAKIAERSGEVRRIREPGSTALGDMLRPILKSGSLGLSNQTVNLLFEAVRSDNDEKNIRPALDRGQIVVCDRYTLSTDVYQHTLKPSPSPVWVVPGMEASITGALRFLPCYHTIPDLVLVCIASPSTIDARRGGRDDNDCFTESADKERAAYIEASRRLDAMLLASTSENRVVIMDVDREPEAIEAEIECLLRKALH